MEPVVIIGGGYAGVHAARQARRAGVPVTMVEPSGSHVLRTRLAAIAAGRLPAADAAGDLDELLDIEVVPARASVVDPASRTVVLHDGRERTYGALVVTVGAQPSAPPVPGLAEHGLPLASVADTLALRQRLGVERTRPHARVPLVVVGGGATGVQLAAEVARREPSRQVTLVEQQPRLLPTEPRVLGRAARRILRGAGVDVRLSTAVDRVDAQGAVLADGARLDGTVAWAGGWRATGSDLLPEAATEQGRLVVDATLGVPGAPGVFAAGDAAAHRDPLGRMLPMSAQIAARAGHVAGANAAALLTGHAASRALLVELGRVVDLGGHLGVARVGPVTLARRPLDRLVPVLHHAIDARHLWQVGGLRAVRAHAWLPARVAPLVRGVVGAAAGPHAAATPPHAAATPPHAVATG